MTASGQRRKGPDGDPDAPLVMLPAQGLPPGSIAVKLSGSQPPVGSEVVLQVVGGDGSEVEHVITVGPDWPQMTFVHSTVRIERAQMHGARVAGVVARLRRAYLGEIYRHAARRDPKEALRSLGWRVSGKKLRAHNMLLRLVGAPRVIAYGAWIARNREVWEAEVEALRRCRAQAQDVPAIKVVSRGPGFAPAALAEGATDWIVVLRTGERLSPDAVPRIEKLASGQAPPTAITWDSDSIDARGRRFAPELKPQWNEALFLARDYAGAFAVSMRAVKQGRQAIPDLPVERPDALLLLAAQAGRVAHVPRVLSHVPAGGASQGDETAYARRALVERYIRHESPAASVSAAPAGCLRVTFPLPNPAPKVSLIVATRDRVDLLRPCVEGLRHRTDYPDLEIVIADNGSTDQRTVAYLRELEADRRVRIVRCPGPFNFAAINNRAAAEASGSVIGFVNNDIEVMEPAWLREMVGHALRRGIGAVGARLLYASGLVQHAGVILGVRGYAGHAHRFMHPRDQGALCRLQAQQYYAAVTAACLVVERSKFEIVGGFDAEAFPVAYNDVDLCLRLRAAGFETFWTPYAELLHKESASRAKDYSATRLSAYRRECQALLDRWGDLVADDPYYHPALSRELENFSLE
jgi:GT2 family glycosyltransferase